MPWAFEIYLTMILQPRDKTVNIETIDRRKLSSQWEYFLKDTLGLGPKTIAYQIKLGQIFKDV